MSFIGNRTFGTFGRLSTSFQGELALLVCPKSPTLMLSQEVLHPLLAQFMGKNLHPLVLLPWNWIQRRQTPPDPLSAWWEQFVIWEIFKVEFCGQFLSLLKSDDRFAVYATFRRSLNCIHGHRVKQHKRFKQVALFLSLETSGCGCPADWW